MVSDLDNSSLLEVIDSHQSGEIIEVLDSQALAVQEKVKVVSVDLWGGFPRVIKAEEKLDLHQLLQTSPGERNCLRIERRIWRNL